MSQDEFTAIHGKLAEHDKRFDRVDEKLDSLTKVVLDIRDMVGNNFERADKRITRIEETIGISE